MSGKIISVKVAPRVLVDDNRHYMDPAEVGVFPFERVYLTTDPKIPQRSFRYYLSMPLTDKLLAGLNRIVIHNVKHKTLEREETFTEHFLDQGKQRNQFSDIDLSDDWTLIVPTRTVYHYEGNKRVRTLGYVMLKNMMSAYYNERLKLPQITLHGNGKSSIILCSSCVNVSQMYDNACSPGTHTCSQQHKVVLGVQNRRYNYSGSKVR